MESIPLLFENEDGLRQRVTTRTHRTADGCLEWTGATDDCGYGIVATKLAVGGLGRWGWRPSRVHRVMWALDGRELIAGMVLDHLCRNRLCCEVTHLEQVTQAENVRRQPPPSDVCVKCGASDWKANGPQRRCRPCWNAYHREYQRKQSHGGGMLA